MPVAHMPLLLVETAPETEQPPAKGQRVRKGGPTFRVDGSAEQPEGGGGLDLSSVSGFQEVAARSNLQREPVQPF